MDGLVRLRGSSDAIRYYSARKNKTRIKIKINPQHNILIMENAEKVVVATFYLDLIELSTSNVIPLRTLTCVKIDGRYISLF